MKHKVCINVANPGGTPTPVVRSGTVQIRKRLLDFLFGQQVNVLVLFPPPATRCRLSRSENLRKEVRTVTNNQKYNLFLDAVRITRSLADVFEAIADTYRDATVVETDAKVIEAQEVKQLPAEKEVTLEDVRAVLGQKSQAGMTAEVRELIRKYGGTRLSDIDPEQYKALLAEAEVLGNE